jgi:hypothetical protein
MSAGVYIWVMSTGIFVCICSLCALAWQYGRTAERCATVIFISEIVLLFGYAAVTHRNLSTLATVYVHMAVACCYLLLALRYANYWIGGLMLAKSCELAIDMGALDDFGLSPLTVYYSSNALTVLALFLILATSIASHFKRRSLARSALKAPAAGLHQEGVDHIRPAGTLANGDLRQGVHKVMAHT